jgi:hypothetical protein
LADHREQFAIPKVVQEIKMLIDDTLQYHEIAEMVQETEATVIDSSLMHIYYIDRINDSKVARPSSEE